MRKELDKFKVIIEQIDSPAEFWLEIPNTHGLTNLCAAQNQNVHRKTTAIKDHNQYLLRGICAIAIVSKCYKLIIYVASLKIYDKYMFVSLSLSFSPSYAH